MNQTFSETINLKAFEKDVWKIKLESICPSQRAIFKNLPIFLLLNSCMQLSMVREAGSVFKGWNEGKIMFAPTYKYSHNSDSYVGETANSKKKRRTPSWYISVSSQNLFALNPFDRKEEMRMREVEHQIPPLCLSLAHTSPIALFNNFL